jgi:very-short-patch-repair endonuclease
VEAAEALVMLGGVADTATLVRASSRRKVRTAVAAGVIVRDARGRYALPSAQEALRAANRLAGVVSHGSAAASWGWKSKWPPRRPSVTVPRNRKVSASRRTGVDLHYAELTEGERRSRVTGKARTVIDCAKQLPFDEALAIADSALRNDDVTGDELIAYADRLRTTGRPQALRVAREADARADNPFESVLRAIALDVPGLSVVPQALIDEGGLYIRPDLVDRVRRIVVEAESFEFHSDRAALLRDCERYNELGRRGWSVYRFTWGNVMRAPWYVSEVLTDAVALPLRPERPT